MNEWWTGWKPSQLLVVSLRSIFAYYSNLKARWSKVAKLPLCGLWFTEGLVVVAYMLPIAAQDGVVMSKSVGPQIVAEGLHELGPRPDRLPVEDLGLLCYTCLDFLDWNCHMSPILVRMSLTGAGWPQKTPLALLLPQLLLHFLAERKCRPWT